MSNGTILIVEDDVNLLTGIRDILQLEGYTIHTAQNGLKALEKLQSLPIPPDLIVSDIMMPGMDGIELLQQVRGIERFVSIPFIYLTAKGEKSDILRGKQLGVDDYVVKPFNANDLLVAIESRLDRARTLHEVQLNKQEALKQNILTILNHEFRTPLTFVVAYSDMLKDVPQNQNGAPHQESGEMLTFLQGVRSGADRLRRLIENFIMLVELETGSAHKTFSWRKAKITDLEGILYTAAEQANHIQNNPHAYRIESEAIPPFMGDQEYLQVALVHLLDNAFKFSDPDDEVLIRAALESNTLIIEIEDHGRGIPPNEIQNIWQMFYQIDRPQYEDQGAGSGLAIVQGIVALHNGHVDVSSEPGVGTTFTLSLPLSVDRQTKPQQS